MAPGPKKRSGNRVPAARGKTPSNAVEEVLTFETAAAFSKWLAKHHATSAPVWLKLAKKGGGAVSLSASDALDVVLCWGWIDGVRRAHDDAWFLQRYSRRTSKSPWSKLNRERVARLEAAGRMQPPGTAEVERAKADGRWDAAYDSPSRITVPDDLAAALKRNAAAAKFFATLNSTNRYAVLYRVHQAKRPETRAARIAKFVEMLARGEKLHP